MARLSAIITLLAGGAVMLPLFACGHGMELMQARLEFEAEGTVRLEITADFGGNPMLNSEEEAHSALQDLMLVQASGEWRQLAALSPLQWEERHEFDPTSPVTPPPATEGQPHQLLTAVWRWKPSQKALCFKVREGSVHDVLFWYNDSAGKSQWRVLITGESTPPLPVPLLAAPTEGLLMGGHFPFVLLCVSLTLAIVTVIRKGSFRHPLSSPSSTP